MTLQAAILAWLLALTPSQHDSESEPERVERMGTIATAIDIESGGRFIFSAAAMAIIQHESKSDQILHAGGKHPVWRQDGGRSACLMQIHRNGLRDDELWGRLAGTDLASTRLCIGAGLMLWDRYWGCWRRAEKGERWNSMFSAYGTGAGCEVVDKGRKKEKTFRQALSHLYLHAKH